MKITMKAKKTLDVHSDALYLDKMHETWLSLRYLTTKVGLYVDVLRKKITA